MEDWQEWQIRADRIAAELGRNVDALDKDFFAEQPTTNLRSFWPRFRELKEGVRLAPAIRLEDKLGLERRLRSLGSRAYKAQEESFVLSTGRKNDLVARIEALRIRAGEEDSPASLRTLRRDVDAVRREFDSDSVLVPADRQALWAMWRATNQLVWDRLTELWSRNETVLRDMLAAARTDIEQGNGNSARQNVRKFFESLRTHEAKQDVITALKAEADGLRREADNIEEQRQTARAAATIQTVPSANPVQGWRLEFERNQESLARLMQEVFELERQFDASDSVLGQAMVRGTLVEKKRRVAELERANRTLGNRIEQTEEAPLIFTA